MLRASLAKLGARSVDIALDGECPTEFRLFKSGENTTTKGVFLFDAKAAELVLSEASRHAVDLMIDLEHLSLDQESRAYDPDARAWFNLAIREGELWAVNVRWTPDGARRLSEKTQRYISPAFFVDDDNRVIEIVSIALVAMPATHETPALVAANRRPLRMKTLAERKNALLARVSVAKSKIAKLADDEGSAPSGKFAAVKAASEKVIEAMTAVGASGDVDTEMAAMDAASAAVKEYEAAVAAMAGVAVEPVPAAVDPEPTPTATSDVAVEEDKAKQASRDKAEVVSLRKELARRDDEIKIQKLAAEMDERRGLVASLVVLGRETPATAWADETATSPRGSLATMPIVELRDRVRTFGGKVGAAQLGRVLPPTSSGITAGGSSIELSAFEAERVKCYADKRAAECKAAGIAPRSCDEVLSRYVGHREQQLRGAKTDESVKRLGRRVEQGHVMLSSEGRLVSLASTPVRPIEEFGQSSQRALEEFRMNYNMALAAEPKVWAELLGDMMPSGSVTKDTYPINLSTTRYVERTAQSAATETALNFDISVTKKEFYTAEQVELRRLQGGDFAYVMSWARRAERVARARVFLRNQLVTAILEAGDDGYWGSSSELATGIDGQPFFSASHKVHPFDATRKLRGSATFSNYQSAAKPLNAANLTGQKVTAFQVADPNGREYGYEYDAILNPSSLNEVSKNLITVQDLILEAGTVNGVANTMGATRNPHFQSGMEVVRAPDLAGTDTAADWYLLSRAAISAGLFPWVISEDAAEDLRTWDEQSDFYKDGGFIKVASHIFCNAVLLFPYAIRLVRGA